MIRLDFVSKYIEEKDLSFINVKKFYNEEYFDF